MLFWAVDFSRPPKKYTSRPVSGAWKRTSLLHQKGRGTDAIFFTVAVFKQSQLLDHYTQKTLSPRIVKIPLSKQKTYCRCFFPEKRGRGTDPVERSSSSAFKAGNTGRRAESSNCETISADVKRLKHSTQQFAGETSLLKLHYQIRLSVCTAVCNNQPHPRSPATDCQLLHGSNIGLLKLLCIPWICVPEHLLAGWTYWCEAGTWDRFSCTDQGDYGGRSSPTFKPLPTSLFFSSWQELT